MQIRIAKRASEAVHYVVRSERRLRGGFVTRLQCDGRADAAFTLRNVSPSGFMGECAAGAEPLRAGAKVALLLPLGGRVEADIRWALKGRIGCRLRARLTFAQRALVLALTVKNWLVSWAAVRALIALVLVAVLATR